MRRQPEKVALFENFGKELRHGFPGSFVRPFIVSRAFGIVVARVGLGKGMDGAAVFDELPVHARSAHFVFKGGDVLRRRSAVIRAMAHQHLALDVFAVRRRRRIESTVETDNACDVRTAACQFNDRRPAKTVADGRDAFLIHERLQT